MPYVDEKRRLLYKNITSIIDNHFIETKGDLEYLIFYLMNQYMSDKDFKYSTLHDCVYASIHCGDEFRRRFLDVREDDARKKNGDV